MLKLETEYTLRNGEVIKLGDKLQGKQTHEMVVLLDEKRNKVIVQPLEEKFKDFCFDLDSFISKWNDIEITGSILKRPSS